MMWNNPTTRMKTELEIDGRTVIVYWEEYRDTLIPENKNIVDRFVDYTEPPVDIDDDTLLRMIEEVESGY